MARRIEQTSGDLLAVNYGTLYPALLKLAQDGYISSEWGVSDNNRKARALGGDPLILLADEPTGNLDSKNGDAVMDLLKELHSNGATSCMVTHDPRYAHHAERTIHLFDGRIVETAAVS